MTGSTVNRRNLSKLYWIPGNGFAIDRPFQRYGAVERDGREIVK